MAPVHYVHNIAGGTWSAHAHDVYVILQEASPLKVLIIIATRPLVSSPFSYKYPGQLTNGILKFSMAKHVIENSDMSAYTNR